MRRAPAGGCSSATRQRYGPTIACLYLWPKRPLPLRMLAALVLLASAPARAEGSALAALPPALLAGVDDLVRAASAACELVPLQALAGEPARLEALDVVEYRLGGARRLRAAEPLRPEPGAELPLYVPGWWNTAADEAARALAAALLRDHPAVLVLDTRRAFGRGYLAAAARVDAVAEQLARLVGNLSAAGVPPGRVHVIGFSLGAHVAGAAGRLVRRRLRAPLGRITALDAARPCFTRAERRLRAGDAAFVQAIHSSAGVLGLAEPLGHADLYVNGVAGRQPQCRAAECDHNRAWRLFAASVRDRGAARAQRCASWAELQQGRCSGGAALMGYPCSAAARGMFLHKSGS